MCGFVVEFGAVGGGDWREEGEAVIAALFVATGQIFDV